MEYFFLVHCSVPEPSSKGIFNFSATTEGSKMTITCSERLYLQPGEIEFICIGGSWFPDPNDEYCYEAQQELGKHSLLLLHDREDVVVYSGTSDNGHSEKWTTSIECTNYTFPQPIIACMHSVHFYAPPK